MKKKQYFENNMSKEKTMPNTVNFLAELTRKDIERSYNIDPAKDTEIYYSNRYGWSLRRAFE